jgi:P27 family predicted phage terminase small subunit
MAKGVKPAVRTDRAAYNRAPPVPLWLSPDAKKEWKRIMPLLIERKILTEADMGSVENYCIAIGRVREIERQIQEEGLSPQLFRMQDKAAVTARLIAAELGLTPVSRSRPIINDDAEPEDDPLGL